MFGLLKSSEKTPEAKTPVLELSGPRLRHVFDDLGEAAEATGGIERYVTALSLKASLFSEVLGRGRVEEADETEFMDLAAFIAPVRRRIGAFLAENKYEKLQKQITLLLAGWSDLSTADQRLEDFISAFPKDRDHRWIRDLGAEILHFVAPERYPLMTRWIWDEKVGSGVLREIWHGDNVDQAKIEIGDGLAMHLTLRDELEGFLRDQGVYRDLHFHIDLLCAHIYAGYINDRGGQYLKADFCGESATGDHMLHTRRMLGLDAIDTETGRTKLKLIDGKAHVLGERLALN